MFKYYFVDRLKFLPLVILKTNMTIVYIAVLAALSNSEGGNSNLNFIVSSCKSNEIIS